MLLFASATLGFIVPLAHVSSATGDCSGPETPTLQVVNIAPDDPDGGLNIRAEASPQARIIYVAVQGETVTSLDQCNVIGPAVWWKVSVGEVEGWANSNFLAPPTTIPPTTIPPPTTQPPSTTSAPATTTALAPPTDPPATTTAVATSVSPQTTTAPVTAAPPTSVTSAPPTSEPSSPPETSSGSAAELSLGIGIGAAVLAIGFGLFQRLSPSSASSLSKFNAGNAVPASQSPSVDSSQRSTPDEQRGRQNDRSRSEQQTTSAGKVDGPLQPDVIFVDLSPQPSKRYRPKLSD